MCHGQILIRPWPCNQKLPPYRTRWRPKKSTVARIPVAWSWAMPTAALGVVVPVLPLLVAVPVDEVSWLLDPEEPVELGKDVVVVVDADEPEASETFFEPHWL